MSDLTLVLPIKDREFYSRRLLAYLDEIRCPYPIIIADGGAKDSRIQKLLEDDYYDNIKCEYLRCPYDEDVSNFYEKMAKAMLDVETPLSMVIDNDDFFTINGIDYCIEFLRKNNDFVSARGAMTGVHIYGDKGIEEREDMYTEFPDPIIGDTAQERINKQATHFHGNWHNVVRTEALQLNWSLMWYFSPENLRFCEQIIGFLNVVWGDGLRDNSFCHIVHQHQTPRVIKSHREFHFPPDQNEWINQKGWSRDFGAMTDAIAFAISACDGIDFEDSREEFRKSYTEMYIPRVSDKDFLISRIDESKKYCSDERIENFANITRSINPFEMGNIETKIIPQDIHRACEDEMSSLQNFLRTMS